MSLQGPKTAVTAVIEMIGLQNDRHSVVSFGTNSFGSVIIIAHDLMRSPVSRFFHSGLFHQ